jgi:hypothetical protein
LLHYVKRQKTAVRTIERVHIFVLPLAPITYSRVLGRPGTGRSPNNLTTVGVIQKSNDIVEPDTMLEIDFWRKHWNCAPRAEYLASSLPSASEIAIRMSKYFTGLLS